VLRLLFARHGESEWNALGRWQGQSDPPLSDRGRQQARLAASGVIRGARRTASPVTGIVSSTLARALETATILSDELAIAPVHLEPDLIERDAGEWSGLTRAEIEQRYPGFLADGKRPPGYEADNQLLARVLRAVEHIVGRFAGVDGPATVVVITHGGVIYSLEQHLGAGFQRKPNLGARWFLVRDRALQLSGSTLLVDPAAATTPDLL
jgi:probable phosphoglycerate mutase